ncbi:hypothetical protein [Streptacidiphilus rugosus]|uniref:hypothetical protein n=1 Tax=Streptacidiphilus rugosus TaxID=405783 RepID=UPI00056AEAFE|nr:hypothetical protein [Streptacidiphilus rugosus]
MARFRNDHGEDRIVPTLGYILVPAGTEVTVPDDEWEHWEAGGWTPLTPDPRPADEPAAAPAPVAAAAPAKTAAPAAAPAPASAPTAPAESEATR